MKGHKIVKTVTKKTTVVHALNENDPTVLIKL